MLRLIDLEPTFVRHELGTADESHGRPTGDGNIQWGGFPVDVLAKVNSICEADGISFLCPKCFYLNRGSDGTHRIQLFFAARNVPEHIGVGSSGQPSRWDVRGNDFFDLTLAPSILTPVGCRWHGFIEHGFVRSV